MKRILTSLSAGLVGLGLAGAIGCAGVTRTLDKGTGAVGEVLLPVSQEGQVGKQLAEEINRTEKVHPDPQVQAYLRKVGARIVQASKDKRKGIQYSFTVIDEPKTVNAFAVPGGPIYVYSGLILAAKSEAELAAVLGHEVGHIVARHSARSLGTAFSLDALAKLALGQDPGTITQLATGIAAQGYMSRHSRDAEREADDLGLGYLIAAGYDPQAMPRFFDELARLGGSSNAVAQFFASHPEPSERAKRLQSAIRGKGAPKGKSEIVGGFAAIQAKLSGKSAPAKKSSTGTSSGTSGSTSSKKSGSKSPAPAPSPRK